MSDLEKYFRNNVMNTLNIFVCLSVSDFYELFKSLHQFFKEENVTQLYNWNKTLTLVMQAVI